ncbi:MAG: anion permease, partial [Corynebacterium casei]|nr:anion permease [Corynebacterium casei]
TIRQVPWNLLLFMAATIAMSGALLSSGAADVLATAILGSANPMVFVALVIIVSSAAHLVIQSRSARSAVLIPLVVATAPAVGVNPVAVAFISTVAAGFCHTLPSSAKPLAIFSGHEPAPFANRELMRMAAVLFPIHLLVMALFAWLIWPALGLNLYL